MIMKKFSCDLIIALLSEPHEQTSAVLAPMILRALNNEESLMKDKDGRVKYHLFTSYLTLAIPFKVERYQMSCNGFKLARIV